MLFLQKLLELRILSSHILSNYKFLVIFLKSAGNFSKVYAGMTAEGAVLSDDENLLQKTVALWLRHCLSGTADLAATWLNPRQQHERARIKKITDTQNMNSITLRKYC